jgi:NitT/TauT family transport system permease protein/taurine transport system permease protein
MSVVAPPSPSPAGTRSADWWRSPAALRNLCLLTILVLWEIAPRLEWVPPVMLAPLSKTILAGVLDFGTFFKALVYTVGELLLALGIAVSLGGIGGLVLGGIRPLRETALPLLSSAYAIPLVVVYPLFTAWTGIGPESKVLFGGAYGFFPMLLATAAGMQTVDHGLLRVARSMGATWQQSLLQVFLPAAIPSVLSGLRLGVAMTAIGVIVAEMMAATDGIGFLITQNRTMFNTAEVYFGVFLVLVLAGSLDWCVRALERRAAGWYPQKATAV